jgi:hypothetical protein
MSAEHRRRLRERQEATTSRFNTFRSHKSDTPVVPFEQLTESSLEAVVPPELLAPPELVAPPETVVPPVDDVQGSESLDAEYAPVPMTEEEIAKVVALLPAKPKPFTKNAKAAYVDAIVLAMFEMDQDTYQLALQHIYNTDQAVYDLVYAALTANNHEDKPAAT